jgi:hypothetical protein
LLIYRCFEHWFWHRPIPTLSNITQHEEDRL